MTARPDFHVSYFLEVRRQLVSREETPATQSLSSLHDSPSYEVQSSERRVDVHETGHLTILVSDSGEQTVIWRGGFEGRLRGETFRQLTDAVASVFGHFPASDAGNAEGAARGAPGRAESTGESTPPSEP